MRAELDDVERAMDGADRANTWVPRLRRVLEAPELYEVPLVAGVVNMAHDAQARAENVASIQAVRRGIAAVEALRSAA
jgi:hypothetical protein